MLQVLPSKKKMGKREKQLLSQALLFAFLFFFFLIGIMLPSYRNTNNKNLC